MRLPRWFDPFIAAVLAVVALAAVLPARGTVADVLDVATALGIALLFFLHGAKMAPAAAMAGARHWRLHVVVLLSTFALFPVLGIGAGALVPGVLTAELHQGLLFLCAAPSTVQSSIAFTSIAHGNVPAAVFSATFSNLAGVVLTPALAVLLLSGTGDLTLTASGVGIVVVQVIVPFAVGQLCRRWTAGWIARHHRVVSVVDRGSIVLVVYTAFSAGVVAGVWRSQSPASLAVLLGVVTLLLVVVMLIVTGAGRLLRFDRADRVAVLFCGSKKSIATGLPIASVLVGGAGLALLILPLMLFHQVQLIVCAALARRWSHAGTAR